MTNTLIVFFTIIGGALTVLGATASAWAYLKSRQIAETLDLSVTANAELRNLVEDYKAQVQELTGQVQALQSSVVLEIVSLAQKALKEAITEAVRDGFKEGLK